MARPSATSLIDQVDMEDNVVGQTQRSAALSAGNGFRTAHVFVFDQSNRVLLQQLSSARQRHALRWGSSVAGYLHAGEDYRLAALRRSSEEIGLQVALDSLGKFRMSEDNGAVKWIELFAARASNAIILENDHIDQLSWWSLDDLDQAVGKRPQDFTPTFVFLYNQSRSLLPSLLDR